MNRIHLTILSWKKKKKKAFLSERRTKHCDVSAWQTRAAACEISVYTNCQNTGFSAPARKTNETGGGEKKSSGPNKRRTWRSCFRKWNIFTLGRLQRLWGRNESAASWMSFNRRSVGRGLSPARKWANTLLPVLHKPARLSRCKGRKWLVRVTFFSHHLTHVHHRNVSEELWGDAKLSCA